MDAPDERPPVWAGHIVAKAVDIAASAEFYIALGMREVATTDRVSVLELRGGTHLVVVAGDPPDEATFDLMVDDLDATHADWTERGFNPSPIERGDIHDAFHVVDPSGTKLTVNSSHVVGVV